MIKCFKGMSRILNIQSVREMGERKTRKAKKDDEPSRTVAADNVFGRVANSRDANLQLCASLCDSTPFPDAFREARKKWKVMRVVRAETDVPRRAPLVSEERDTRKSRDAM